MIWLYIHLGIGFVTYLLFTFAAIDAAVEFKRRYPDIKIPKTLLITKIGIQFRTMLICVFPIVNILYFLAILFKTEELKEKTIEKCRIEYSRYPEQQD
jgi:hypothetical protein